jgi:hypothetical protein
VHFYAANITPFFTQRRDFKNSVRRKANMLGNYIADIGNRSLRRKSFEDATTCAM